jgi:hypothetical protein
MITSTCRKSARRRRSRGFSAEQKKPDDPITVTVERNGTTMTFQTNVVADPD